MPNETTTWDTQSTALRDTFENVHANMRMLHFKVLDLTAKNNALSEENIGLKSEVVKLQNIIKAKRK